MAGDPSSNSAGAGAPSNSAAHVAQNPGVYNFEDQILLQNILYKYMYICILPRRYEPNILINYNYENTVRTLKCGKKKFLYLTFPIHLGCNGPDRVNTLEFGMLLVQSKPV